MLPLLWAAALAQSPTCPDAQALSWLHGSWATEADGARTEEHWTAARGGTLMGVGRTIQGEQTAHFEHLMLRPNASGCLEYLAWPGGSGPTAFTWVRGGTTDAVFENAAHDWPQRIHYVRAADTLVATISDLAGERVVELRFAAVP